MDRVAKLVAKAELARKAIDLFGRVRMKKFHSSVKYVYYFIIYIIKAYTKFIIVTFKCKKFTKWFTKWLTIYKK